jgi:hypothetical protein
MLLLKDRLIAAGDWEAVGGSGGLANIFTSVPHAAHVTYYANIVRSKATARNLIMTCGDLLNDAYRPEQDPDDLLNIAEQQVFAIRESRQSSNLSKIDEVLSAINDATTVLSASGNAVMLLECGAMVRTPQDPSRQIGGRAATGGVIVLVHDNGLIVTDKPTKAASPPIRAIYEPDSRTSRGGVTMDLSSLRGEVRKALLQKDVQVFASTNGMLSVPCRLYAKRPAILYGKLGVTFRGDTIKTVGTTDDPKNLGFVAI